MYQSYLSLISTGLLKTERMGIEIEYKNERNISVRHWQWIIHSESRCLCQRNVETGTQTDTLRSLGR